MNSIAGKLACWILSPKCLISQMTSSHSLDSVFRRVTVVFRVFFFLSFCANKDENLLGS